MTILYRQMDTWTDGQTDRYKDRQMDRSAAMLLWRGYGPSFCQHLANSRSAALPHSPTDANYNVKSKLAQWQPNFSQTLDWPSVGITSALPTFGQQEVSTLSDTNCKKNYIKAQSDHLPIGLMLAYNVASVHCWSNAVLMIQKDFLNSSFDQYMSFPYGNISC